jgi:hypothetical protein
MGWNQKVGALERLIEIGAALCLGAGAAFATVMLAPLAGPALAGVAGIGALVPAAGALLLLGRVDPPRSRMQAFEPVDINPVASEQSEEDELLLDDPIAAPKADSRVVQLFGDEPLPAPGELVTRIADFLESGRGPVREQAQATSNEASAALHAALADIRRSLR